MSTSPVLLAPPTRVVAHRGSSARAPENTLAALACAVADGADLVEVDVQRTRDGHLVLLHDPGLARTTDAVRGARAPDVSEVTLTELRRHDAGSWFSPGFAGERVPTLVEALALLEAAGIGLQLELKAPHLHPGVVADLADLLTGRHGRCHVLVQCFDEVALAELAERAPWLPLGLLGRPDVRRLPALGEWLREVNPHHRRLDRRYVDAVHAAGLQCVPWTVDRPSSMRRVLGLGVDGVITDHPARLVELVRPTAAAG